MRARKRAGFTLIELLIALSVIAIIITILLPNLLAAFGNAHDVAAKGYLHHVVKGIESARERETYKLPPARSCAALTFQAQDPSSVTSCRYLPDPASDSYTVTAVSAAGTTFVYDGSQIVQLP